MINDTIAAISTPVGEGGISIIKISGNEALNIVSEIFTNSNKLENRKMVYGYIEDKGIKIDEVLISFMQSPNTYTGEDVVEINCHGGILITNKILSLVIKKGARVANPGEFTQRAFLNGKKDMSEVQTIYDLLEAQNEQALNMAINSLNTSTKSLIQELYNELMAIVTNIEINIDYPEYDDINVIKNQEVKEQIKVFIEKLNTIIKDSKRGEIIKNGINTALIGKPNVGKSSILNLLSQQDKAIVSNIEGTTRDMIESNIILGNLQLNLIDTAGIRQSDDEIEKLGVEKSLNQINAADLILFVRDITKPLDSDEQEILNKIEEANKKYLIINNKVDELVVRTLEYNFNAVDFSAKLGQGLDELENKIVNLYDLQNFDSNNAKYINVLDTRLKLEDAYEKMQKVNGLMNEDYYLDLVLLDLKEVLEIFSDLLGINFKEDYLNEMFSRFCVGK